MGFGGRFFEAARDAFRLLFVFPAINIFASYAKFAAIEQQQLTRKLANDINGKPTYFRPDELATQSQALWAIAFQVGIILVLSQVSVRLKNLEPELRNPGQH